MTQTNDWWTPFFTQFFGGVQLDEDKTEVTRREVDALERLLSLSGSMRILDVPCGTGRHTLELARRGHQVTGVDFNPQVLDAGRARATSEGLNAEFRQADMRRLDYDAVFDRALCHWGSFGYFDDADNLQHLHGVSRALRAGGMFFLDARVAETLYPRFRERDWYTWGEGDARRLVLEDRRLDHEHGRIESTWTVVHGAQERTEHVSMRIYAFSELRRMLEAAGFATLRAFDGAEREFKLGADRLWLVAEKPG